MRTAAFAAILLAGAASIAATADAPADRGTIVVTTEDGSIVPLHSWSLSYEYGLAKPGTSPLFAPTARKPAWELYLGKKALPLAGQVLTLTYVETMRSTETDSGVTTVKIKTPKELTLAGSGESKTFKIEAPARDLLVESPEKGVTVMARTLDVQGETITGTKKDFCLVSYTPVVECGGTAADRVVKVEFQR
ncbi:MAG TPA: hypothetical protein VFK70_12885 [Vicinamibacteria bacterium]|nr:hypothetical protein [Vicinamibacteria bacterium]